MNLRVLESEFRLSWVDWVGIGFLMFVLVLGALAFSKHTLPSGRPIP